MNNINSLVKAYIRQFDSFFKLESYKWSAVKHFQHVYFNSKLSLVETLKDALKPSDNLLASNNYYPARMIEFFAQDKPSETKEALNILFDESEDLVIRVSAFIDNMENTFHTMKNEGYRDWKYRTNVQSFQDTHAASVYLTLHNPSSNYIYKWSIFKAAAEIMGYSIESKNKIEKLSEFYSFCDKIKKVLLTEKLFISDYETLLMNNGFSDPNYNLLTQDFVYAVARYLNADSYRKKDKKKSLARHTRDIESKDFFPFEPKIEDYFKGKKGVDYTKIDEQNRDLGKAGEIWAVNYEKERLREKEINFEVRHASLLDGDGLGYDILSVEDDGITPRYIEVKTTTGGAYQPFFFSVNELKRSIQEDSHYYLYRICNFKSAVNQADVVIVKGSLAELDALPVSYKAEIKH